MYDESFVDRLNLAISKAGGLKKVVDTLGFSYATIDRWKKGDTDPKVSNILKLCEIANVSIDWLVNGTEYKNGDNFEMNKEEFSDFDSIQQEFSFIRGYKIEASAGYGSIVYDESINGFFAYRNKWLKDKGLVAKNLMVIYAKGDSMFPTISDGDAILVNTAIKSLTDGWIYVIRQNEELLVKRLQRIKDGVKLISDNKIYESVEVDFKYLNTFEVIGKVVNVSRDL